MNARHGGFMTDSAAIEVMAPPERVWKLVSDVRNYGKWSPENRETDWRGAIRHAQIGARFRGRNRKGLFTWWTTAEVVECEPGAVFEFVTYVAGRRSTYWRYELSEIPEGTRVVESYEVVFSPFRPLFGLIGRKEELKRGLEQTLKRLKQAAESEQPV
jgi:uncharacterized protein YndB with AHSA1/START domain